jgi:iron(III) transport system substrate-binding protein
MDRRIQSSQRHCEPAGRSNLLIFAMLFLAACSPEPAAPPPRQDPVVVYAAFEDDGAIVEMFDRYKEETGVLVIVRRGPADRIVNDLINNNISPPADVLMTRSVVDAWNAAEESALRPLYSEAVADRIPAWARDPDDLWFATSIDEAVLVYSGDKPSVHGPAELTSDEFRGKLCLSSSQNAINRAVIATLIDRTDLRSTEIMVRGWVENLALPPFATEEQLLSAIDEGSCKLGIASRRAASLSGVAIAEADTLYTDIEAIGLARHARNPEGAAALVEWLVSDFEWQGEAPPVLENVGLVAWHYADAIKLAERARYP